MKKLLVGSVFAPDARNETWLRLQFQFLRKTVSDFDHVVYLNRVEPSLFGESLVLGQVPATEDWAGDELPKAMDALMEYFISQPGYENYLMIDSDAFPIRDGWIEELYGLMEERTDGGFCTREFAAPIRCENLDMFPHGSAFFAKGDWFRGRAPVRYAWDYMPRTNIMGSPSKDVTLKEKDAIFDENGRQIWLPLLRTNTINYHPILGAIYGNVFYHHGAGSRSPLFRAVMQGTYANFADQQYTEKRNDEMFDALKNDPRRYIDALTARQTIRRRFRFR